ncbi:MAG: cyclic nucleotide-binding domain-containing protein [Calditrichaeota bacterium]|nr:cyclic nucleotide-binding domain-containing protein [Calditrichota bacterium]MCB0293826.1 cyclic nucleotide-binding domain-containing protein [Calditrichota bacterium]MCB0303618.1 cyclic nucleotide-binding domain-containing protein [Calditrichota bacterium]MCB0314165.1 cyclic nucleotide-binding domain-containing protein [Calditrichota bacterium]MCB9086857.1 cyclic nucleotide-binding domain-containing protein [Calditrichia bacterium]
MDSFWGNIFRQREKEEEGIRYILRRIPVFKGLNRKELAAVERILYRREYKSGEIIFHQGDPAAGMYIIEKGKVQVVFEPTQQVIAELHDGDFFGELALLDDSPRSATVIARMDCKMLGFFQSDLLDLIERTPRLGVKIVMRLLTVIGERLKKSNEQVQALQIKLYNLKQKRQNIAGSGS